MSALHVAIANYSGATAPSTTLRCPKCRQLGVFESLTNIADAISKTPNGGVTHWFLQRRCPNRDCQTHVFVVLNDKHVVLRSYPAERVDFDTTNVPDRIAQSFQEALSCHAEGAFTAAAIMIRRTLEELCEAKQAKGPTLKDRIGSLRQAVVLPTELFTAMDELRLLGNDAAHIEAKAFDSIGQTETLLGIELTKEILKAVYQLDSLVKRLQALKQ